MSNDHFAHTRKGKPPEEWQLLEEHLSAVAQGAAEFAEPFGSAEWGRLAGCWHDLGKYAKDFQDKLLASFIDPDVIDASVLDGGVAEKRVDHSTAGAVLVYERCVGKLIGAKKDELPAAVAALAMVIAGHHGGLPARFQFEGLRLTPEVKGARLRAAKAGGSLGDLLARELPPPPDYLRPEAVNYPPAKTRPQQEAQMRQFCLRHEFWTRMLFSVLVDADSLDTERFCNRDRAAIREQARGGENLLPRLRERLDAHLIQVSESRRKEAASLPAEARQHAQRVLQLRTEVLDACRAKAMLPPGSRSLTVPTGGGKTLSALAYALDHAICKDLRRVIVVIPFTSIIDQTVKVYRDAIGADLAEFVLEHHSNLDPKNETYDNRPASENWDAPVIVTTSVQFFESLFSRKRSATRKLHNIARSVVVFDEVQTLPHENREPIFDVLNELVGHYGMSALFCTATQPALSLKQVARVAFPHLVGVEEVMPDVPSLFAAVADRVKVEFPSGDERTTWEVLAESVREHDSVLAIVHRRDDARILSEAVGPDTVHLSNLMCAAHRRAVIERIKADVAAHRPIRVVSTTLIEAGVDLDFPVVFRAFGGADSMAQAAGRCNREGRLTDADGRPIRGRLILFRAPSDPPPGLALGLQVSDILRNSGDPLNLFDPATFDRYFREYFSTVNVDRHAVMPLREARNFPAVEEAFRMIEDGGKTDVVVPYGDSADRIEDYRRDPSRWALRGLQPFLVNIQESQLAALKAAALIETIHEQVQVLRASGPQYDPRFGLIVGRVVPILPADLML